MKTMPPRAPARLKRPTMLLVLGLQWKLAAQEEHRHERVPEEAEGSG
jgi:hypothetical protein